jgi:hypothetical protein
MNKELAIKNIKDTLKRLMKFASEKKFTDIETADGTKLQVEDGTELAVGVAIYKLDDAGTQTPCEDGSYDLKDGRTITVVGGLVDSISDASTNPKDKAAESPKADAGAGTNPVAAAATPTTATPDAAPKDGATDANDDADLISRVSAIEDQIAQILEILQGMSNMNEQTMNKVNEFAASPAEDSIKPSKKIVDDVWTKTKNTYNTNKTEIDELKALMKKNSNSNYSSFKTSN